MDGMTKLDMTGYASALIAVSCPRNPRSGQPETVILKALRGRSDLYVVQKAWRVVSDDEFVAAVEMMSHVWLCDGVDHPCPASSEVLTEGDSAK